MSGGGESSTTVEDLFSLKTISFSVELDLVCAEIDADELCSTTSKLNYVIDFHLNLIREKKTHFYAKSKSLTDKTKIVSISRHKKTVRF